MAVNALSRRVASIRSTGWPMALGVALLVGAELAAVAVYVRFSGAVITDPLIVVYPFVWINVGLLVLVTTTPPAASQRRRLLAGIIGVGYFLLLAAVGGVITPGHTLYGHDHPTGLRLALTTMPPGWAPALLYSGAWLNLALLPFKVIGYLALAYLVAVTVLDAAGSAVAGVVGVFSCVSCTWPILGTVISGVFGGASAVAGVAMAEPYGASTLVFLTAVGLLAWRPLR